jgi:hypothetical protein
MDRYVLQQRKVIRKEAGTETIIPSHVAELVDVRPRKYSHSCHLRVGEWAAEVLSAATEPANFGIYEDRIR